MNKFKNKIRIYGLGILAVFIFSIFYITYFGGSNNRDGFLTVAFLDVGQGDAIFIETTNGKQVLIDAGSNNAVLKELSKLMSFNDRSIDLVIATHPDKDHIGGLPAVFDTFEISTYIDSGVSSESAVYSALVARVENEGSQNMVAKRGMRIDLDVDAYIDILFPDRDVSLMNPNDASVIVRLIHGENSFLFTGDSPKKIEDFLVSVDGEGLDVDVLKVGHHGSKTSSSESFMSLASPQIAILSLGANNRYGHPHEEVMETLRRFAGQIFRTDEEGTIIIKSDGNKIYYR